MNITVYLPDELGEKAKAAELPFSRLLRSAIEDRLMAIEAAEKGEFTKIELPLLNDEGQYIGVFQGRELGRAGEVAVYMIDDGRVLLHHEVLGAFRTFAGLDDADLPDELNGQFAPRDCDPGEVMALWKVLNLTPKIAI